MTRTAITLTQNARSHPHNIISKQRVPSTCAHKHTCNQEKLWYSHVLTGWHSWSQHHTYRREEKESRRVSALGSDGGWQELSWEHNRDYRRGKSVMGPSSLSPSISPEGPGISLPSIVDILHYTDTKWTNWQSHISLWEYTCLCMLERETTNKPRNKVLVSN